MITDNPEIRARVLEWQRRYNIQDGDPAMALLELLNLYYRPQVDPAPGANTPQAPVQISPESIVEPLKLSVLPALDRLAFQTQELKNHMETVSLEGFVKQIEGYHEGIDYCTKKLDVIKRETDALLARVEKAASSIRPVTTGAVLLLMGIAFGVGYVLRTILR